MSGEVFHAPLLAANPHFSLYKVLERHHEKSKVRYPEVTVVKEYQDILKDKAVDLVIVNTPNALHFSMAKEALEAGKHVVVEKPFVIHAEEARELVKLAHKKKKLLTVFQNRRLDSDFLTIRKVLEANLLGNLAEYEAHYDRFRNFVTPNTWKEDAGPGSGILYNLGAHMIDQALVLFGLPAALTAKLSIQREGAKTFDSYHIIMDYQQFYVVLKSSYLVRDEGPRYKLLGHLGTFTKYGTDPQEEALKAGKSPDIPEWGKENSTLWGTIDTEVEGLHCKGTIESLPGNYQLFYDNLHQAISEQGDLLVKPEEALQVIRLIELSVQSHKENRTMPVQ